MKMIPVSFQRRHDAPGGSVDFVAAKYILRIAIFSLQRDQDTERFRRRKRRSLYAKDCPHRVSRVLWSCVHRTQEKVVKVNDLKSVGLKSRKKDLEP